MANLPAEMNGSSLSPQEVQLREVIADLVAKGKRPHEIAKAAYPSDRAGRRRLRRKVHRWARRDQDFHQRVAERAHAEMIFDLGPSVAALGRRAAKGRPDAIKLLFEASGFHNPKVQHKHDHSGQVEIKLTMPRPVKTTDDDNPALPQPVDAEVVD